MHSFEDLKLVNDTLHETYQDACNNLGLLVKDYLYNKTLKEASITRPGFHVCQLFAMMFVHTLPSNPKVLFDNHLVNFTDDVFWVDPANRKSRLFSYNEHRLLALFRLNCILANLGSTLDCCRIKLTSGEEAILVDMLPGDKLIEDPVFIEKRLRLAIQSFNKEQKTIFGDVTRALLGGDEQYAAPCRGVIRSRLSTLQTFATLPRKKM
ncbi:hypothetical protein PCANC_08312 [Puccinia coronata f. sp. avenae]|uniref:Uncharacterized protein n=1 Tax=Puccinia coronata f. sp. avenae TaxID=200324 RepID=A0A2N5T4M8_9BASI|nr:hypothetical protein PCANC_08312 [Puccinia coronata f. sp. avenae]